VSEPEITELEFLRKLQRLLNEGDFSATYKFALLNALADLSVERNLAPDGSMRIPIETIAAKFIEYYWPQARPYRPFDGEGFVLLQNAARQASVINAITALQSEFPMLASARRSQVYDRKLRDVAANVETMPLWKLQRIGGQADEFLYRESEYSDRSIRLLPGVPSAFRTLHGLVIDAVRGAWVRRIVQIRANGPVLEHADLASFLFGTARSTLSGFAKVLKAHQVARCLYCGREIRSGGAVDHFIAWTRYPVDLGHNLVLAHSACNGRKRDFLAHPRHVGHWRSSHLDRAGELAERLDAAKLPHNLERTATIACWAYEQGEKAGAHAWIEGNRIVRLDSSWREALRPTELRRVAERVPPEYDEPR
jgi:5-methylcytosine-specific restriction endonuclease McrA